MLLICRFVSGSLCVWIFAVISLELKYKAPSAHTMLEVVEVRWGKAAHIVSIPKLSLGAGPRA